ncbi:MAG: hypothetical protein ABTQ34_03270 [Bdellovibrionales bacterium]
MTASVIPAKSRNPATPRLRRERIKNTPLIAGRESGLFRSLPLASWIPAFRRNDAFSQDKFCYQTMC